MLNTNDKSATEKKANTTNKADLSKIKTGMPVVCSEGGQFGVVDRVEGDMIKLNKDENGVHHFIPTSIIASVDDKVHADRPGEQVKREWKSEAKKS